MREASRLVIVAAVVIERVAARGVLLRVRVFFFGRWSLGRLLRRIVGCAHGLALRDFGRPAGFANLPFATDDYGPDFSVPSASARALTCGGTRGRGSGRRAAGGAPGRTTNSTAGCSAGASRVTG